jgi:hypothetical protein
MKVIDRLSEYLQRKSISPYAFEKKCGLANGYVGKQLRAGGSVGSDILEKVGSEYLDLNLEWLITGRGNMFKNFEKSEGVSNSQFLANEEAAAYQVRDELINILKEQLTMLSSSRLSGSSPRKKTGQGRKNKKT